jgi:hypothetical protein
MAWPGCSVDKDSIRFGGYGKFQDNVSLNIYYYYYYEQRGGSNIPDICQGRQGRCPGEFSARSKFFQIERRKIDTVLCSNLTYTIYIQSNTSVILYTLCNIHNSCDYTCLGATQRCAVYTMCVIYTENVVFAPIQSYAPCDFNM